tara:strand:- start:215 stop:334 length:120 start_codon:yes stop_codon:yes gene_type:complete
MELSLIFGLKALNLIVKIMEENYLASAIIKRKIQVRKYL